MSVRSAVRSSYRAFGKRGLDIVVAGSLLVSLSPLLLVIAVMVRLRLGRPIVFRQRRPGLHGEPFTILKFRTMLDLADADGVPLPGVVRTPPFGARLRAMSLDELPELWNVLKGEMSLVGPRPLMMEYLDRYDSEQARRHDVKPGITGLAQVGGRNALTWEQKFALDLRYVDDHDPWMDLDILVRTVETVVSRRGIRHEEDDDMPEFLGTETPSDR